MKEKENLHWLFLGNNIPFLEKVKLKEILLLLTLLKKNYIHSLI